MCKIEWAFNLHLLSQFTFASAFFPNTCFNTKLPGACRRNGLGGQAVYLELNAFLCFSPRGRLAFPAAPRLGAQTGYLEGGGGPRGCVSLQFPGCPRPDEERKKDIDGTWGRHEKRIGGQGPCLTSLQEPGTCNLGDFEFQGKRNGPFLTLRAGPRHPGCICLFFSPQRGFPSLRQL